MARMSFRLAVIALALATGSGACSILFEASPADAPQADAPTGGCTPTIVELNPSLSGWTNADVELAPGATFSLSTKKNEDDSFIAANGPLQAQYVNGVRFTDVSNDLWTIEGYRYSADTREYVGVDGNAYEPPEWTGLSGTGSEAFFITGFSGFIDANGDGEFNSGSDDQYLARWGLSLGFDTINSVVLTALRGGAPLLGDV